MIVFSAAIVPQHNRTINEMQLIAILKMFEKLTFQAANKRGIDYNQLQPSISGPLLEISLNMFMSPTVMAGQFLPKLLQLFATTKLSSGGDQRLEPLAIVPALHTHQPALRTQISAEKSTGLTPVLPMPKLISTQKLRRRPM